MMLDAGEAFAASIAGLQRRFRAIQRNANDNQGDITKDEFSTDIHGAIAEATVAKYLGLYCNASSGDRSLPDVGFDIEVRSSTNPLANMPIRQRDKDDYKFYFVVGIYPKVRIIGWLYGKEAKQSKWFIDTDKHGNKINNPYWSVPQSALRTNLIEFNDEMLGVGLCRQ